MIRLVPMTGSKMARKPDLDVGDSLEFSETVELEPEKGVKVWMKMGGTTTVRVGETGSKTLNRLSGFIERKIEAKIDEWYDEREKK